MKISNKHLCFFSLRTGYKKIALSIVKDYAKIIKPFYVGDDNLYIYLGNMHVILNRDHSLGGDDFVKHLFYVLNLEESYNLDDRTMRKFMLKLEREERRKKRMVS